MFIILLVLNVEKLYNNDKKGRGKILMNKFCKLFLNRDKVICVEYDPDIDNYYSFVKSNHQKGYKQIMLTSEMMIDIVMYIIDNYNCKITDFEFIEDDEDFKQQLLDTIVPFSKSKMNVFVEKLDFLMQEYSLDIKTVNISGQIDGHSMDVCMHMNGVMTIDKNNYILLNKKIAKKVEGFIL